MADVYPNPLHNLKLDTWYRVLIPIGAIWTFISLLIPIQGFTNKELIILGLGVIAIGIGEWKNERHSTKFVDKTYFNPFMKITQTFRVNDKVGVSIEILGILAIIFSLLNIFQLADFLS